MEIFGSKIDDILKVGHLLDDVGVHNWALTKRQALTALDQFAAKRVAILGGDVYNLDGEPIRLSYDNWYCNREPEEPVDVYVDRSLAKARQYVSSYKNIQENDVLFALVPESFDDN